MMENISAIAAAAPGSVEATNAQRPTSAMSFGDWIGEGVKGVNQQLLTGEADLQALAQGEVQSLHQVMIRLEESRIAFQTFMQVRTRLLDAYQDVMRMQV